MKFQYLVEQLLNEAITNDKYPSGTKGMLSSANTKGIPQMRKIIKDDLNISDDDELYTLIFIKVDDTPTAKKLQNVTKNSACFSVSYKTKTMIYSLNQGVNHFKELGKGSASDQTNCQEHASLLQIQQIIDNKDVYTFEELEHQLKLILPPRIFSLFSNEYYISSVEHAKMYKSDANCPIGKYTVKMQSEVDVIYELANKVVDANNETGDNETHVWSGKDNWNPGDIWVVSKKYDELIEKLQNSTSCSAFDILINDAITNKILLPISLKMTEKNKGKIELITHKSIISSIPNFKKIKDIFISNTGKDSYLTCDNTKFKMRIMGKGSVEGIFFEGQTKGSKVQLGAINKKAMKNITIPKYVSNFELIEGTGEIKKNLNELRNAIVSFYTSKSREHYVQPLLDKYKTDLKGILKLKNSSTNLEIVKILYNTMAFISLKETVSDKLQNEFLQQCYLYAMKINDHSTNYIKLS